MPIPSFPKCPNATPDEDKPCAQEGVLAITALPVHLQSDPYFSGLPEPVMQRTPARSFTPPE